MNLLNLIQAAQLESYDLRTPAEFNNFVITGITHDSRMVRPGFVFVAIQGVPLASRPALDGHAFIDKALALGAVCVVGTQNLTLNVPYIRVTNDRQALGDLASAFHDFPARQLSVIGVTGSKGKSTTTTLIHHILEHAGLAAARMSTVGVRFAGRDEVLPGHFTTPEAPQVQELLRRFVDAACTHVVLEVSSHALALERVRGVAYEVGVWTNLEAEHLDFHGNLEAYFVEKCKLLRRSRFGILNREDDLSFDRLIQLHYLDQQQSVEVLPCWSYGANGDWSAGNLRESSQGLEFRIFSPFGEIDVVVPMIGHFNVLNILAAAAAAAKCGLSLHDIQTALACFPGVPGRMQILQSVPFRVVNDFAHTEQSLRAALKTLRTTTVGRIIVMTGAAGERGLERRLGIARAAAFGADFTIFTEEDSRSESVTCILETMQDAFLQAGGTGLHLEPNRHAAIRWAIQNAQAGDTVLLAGKGHERTLERAASTIVWDENAFAQAALNDLNKLI